MVSSSGANDWTPTNTFATWLCSVSQETNASLAGSRVFVPQAVCDEYGRELLLARLAEWGLVPVDVPEQADLIYPEMPEAHTLTGAQAWARAERGMPVSARLAEDLARSGILRDVRIACSLIVEPKTAVLVERLAAAGAKVGVYCHAHECDQRLADEIAAHGYTIEANASWTADEEHAGALRLLDDLRPNVIIDDGANISRLLVMERPELLPELVGVAEETTSGVRAFQAMARAKELPFPVVAVNDSQLKTRFDNRHGTGETCVTTTMRLLGPNVFAHARVCVIGYGPVGEGFARRVRALGARVTVVDTNPTMALQALFAGFDVCTAAEALPLCDIVVSATGVRHTVGLGELGLMREGAVIVVIGGIANEIALDEVSAAGGTLTLSEDAPGVSELTVPKGPTLHLLAAGDGVNYAAGPGNPIQIMDFSFAVQLCAVDHLLRNRGKLPNDVLRLTDESDRRIATLALEARGVRMSPQTSRPITVPDWRCTRYTDTIIPADEERA